MRKESPGYLLVRDRVCRAGKADGGWRWDPRFHLVPRNTQSGGVEPPRPSRPRASKPDIGCMPSSTSDTVDRIGARALTMDNLERIRKVSLKKRNRNIELLS